MPRTALIFLVGMHLIIGIALSGFQYGGFVTTFDIQLIFLSWFFFGLIIWTTIHIVYRRYSSPHIVLIRALNMKRRRLIEGVAIFTLLALTMQAYMLIKVAIPNLVPYYADPFLAQIDHAIFGTDPWRITHALISPEWTVWLDRFYLFPCLFVSIGMRFWVCFSKDAAFRRRAALTIALTWFLAGNWAALLLSSAGPAYVQHFYGIARYAPLENMLSPSLMAVQAQNYLLANLGQPSMGMGISAMPSMHNASYLLLITFIANRFGIGLKLFAAILFEAMVFISSVHLGWHYAVDAGMSAVLVALMWRISGWLTKVNTPTIWRFSHIRLAPTIVLKPLRN